MARQGHPQFDQNAQTSSSQSFDLSCDNFNQNITGLSLFTRSTPDMELLKRITLTFCDGSEKSVSTQVRGNPGGHLTEQVGEHDEEVHLALGGGAGQHVLLVSAPAEAADCTDPLALLTNSTFHLSDGSLVGLTFDATVSWPAYNWMGVAKAAMESCNRYLARELGPRGIRSNLIAAGPIRTLAAKSIPGFSKFEDVWDDKAPLGWDVNDSTAVAESTVALLSDWFRGTTGSIIHVDGGYHSVGA